MKQPFLELITKKKETKEAHMHKSSIFFLLRKTVIAYILELGIQLPAIYSPLKNCEIFHQVYIRGYSCKSWF